MHDDVSPDVEALTANARSVLETLMMGGPASRADIARRLSLSAATMTKVTRTLLRDGYCVDVEVDAPSTGGRPPRPIDVNVDFAHFVGVKLTATTAFLVVTDARGRVLQEAQEEITAPQPDSVADLIASQVRRLREADPLVAAVGVALSGTAIRTDPVVATSPFLHWKDVPLATMVSDRIGLPVVLENDVRAVTAAEQWFGAGAAHTSFALLTLGAGIGCGIVVHGRQVDGRHGASGLVGHLRVGGSGAMCYAGHVDCANAYATTGGIANRLAVVHGRPLEFDECLQLVDAGDPAARTVFEEAGRAIGTILATVVNLLGPERIFISGEGVDMFDRSRPAAEARMRELLHWTAAEVGIESQPFGFGEWARGAAVVAIQSYVELLNTRDGAAPARPTDPERGAA